MSTSQSVPVYAGKHEHLQVTEENWAPFKQFSTGHVVVVVAVVVVAHNPHTFGQ